MIFGIFTLFIALSVAGVAAWFSIVGLMSIFAASATSIAIMAGSLEVAKLVTASWLYRHWQVTSWAMRTYLSVAVLVLMLITSMGIFGYLSRAHLEQQISVGGDNALQISSLERRIANQKRIIQDANTVLEQLDSTIQTLIEYDRIRGPSGSIATREAQKSERQSLNQSIQTATSNIERLQAELLPLQKQNLELEAEVGPLKYVAELVYGTDDPDTLDQAVRLFILLLVVVFDPLAVMLVLAANQTLVRHGVHLEKKYTHEDPIEEPPTPLPAEPEEDSALLAELQALRQRAHALQADLDSARNQPPEIQEVERVVEVPVDREVIREVEVPVEKTVMVDSDGNLITDDLDTAVRMWMEANQDADVTEQDVRETFQKNQKELKNAQGFWAFPLPRSDRQDS